MWGARKLPRAAKKVLTQYVIEKSDGFYGHNEMMRKRFIAQLEASGLPKPLMKTLRGGNLASQDE